MIVSNRSFVYYVSFVFCDSFVNVLTTPTSPGDIVTAPFLAGGLLVGLPAFFGGVLGRNDEKRWFPHNTVVPASSNIVGL